MSPGLAVAAGGGLLADTLAAFDPLAGIDGLPSNTLDGNPEAMLFGGLAGGSDGDQISLLVGTCDATLPGFLAG